MDLWSLTKQPAQKARLLAFSSSIAARGEEAVSVGFPSKILELNDILENSTFTSPFAALDKMTTDVHIHPPPSAEQLSNNHNDTLGSPGKKKRKIDANSNANLSAVPSIGVPGEAKCTALIGSNPVLENLQTFMRGQYQDLIDLTDTVKLHLNLLVPQIDTADAGVQQAQEECLAELNRAQESGYNLLDNHLKNLQTRAKICSKILKYPNISDYQLALKELDRKTGYLLRQHLVDLRNIYALVTDLLHKNGMGA